MKRIYTFLLYLCLSFSCCYGERVETIYGPFEVEEAVLLDLIYSEPMQRLKDVHQYGAVALYEPCEAYSRYEHSLGVWALLRHHGCSLEEQIAGLLHDVSHTAFSHLGDFFFEHGDGKESYQDSIHAWFLEEFGLGAILGKHGYSIDDVLHKSGNFPGLEQDLPALCADRLDYNLQGAFLRGDISYEEMMAIWDDLCFEEGEWSLSSPELAGKLANFSFHMTFDCWSSPDNFLANGWLTSALLRLIELGKIGLRDVHFGRDAELWARLCGEEDEEVQRLVHAILSVHELFEIVDAGDEPHLQMSIKFRGIDPLIRVGEERIPLSDRDDCFRARFQEGLEQASLGWSLRLLGAAEAGA